jgi:hypothetical protein
MTELDLRPSSWPRSLDRCDHICDADDVTLSVVIACDEYKGRAENATQILRADLYHKRYAVMVSCTLLLRDCVRDMCSACGRVTNLTLKSAKDPCKRLSKVHLTIMGVRSAVLQPPPSSDAMVMVCMASDWAQGFR